jgi:DNA topoisomerase-2
VNAADNYHKDKTMNTIKVEINPEANRISVWNNGKGIPVQIHKEHNCYVPEMIFSKPTPSPYKLIYSYRLITHFE